MRGKKSHIPNLIKFISMGKEVKYYKGTYTAAI